MRTASDVSLRLVRGLTLDPWLLLESRRLAIGMRGDFDETYLKSCYKCKHVHFGRRIVDQGRTAAEMDSKKFDDAMESVEEECFGMAISSVEDLHAHLKANILKATGARKRPYSAMGQQCIARIKRSHTTVFRKKKVLSKR